MLNKSVLVLIPAGLVGGAAASLIYAGVMMLRAGTFTLLSAGIFALVSLVFTLIFRVWWAQIVLFEQKYVVQLKNCLLFLLQHPKKLLLSALIEVLWWGVTASFMPYTGFLVPVLGIWYITLTGVLLVYDDLNAAFQIEEQIAAKNRALNRGGNPSK